MIPSYELDNNAIHKFQSARRRATMERILAFLRNRSADLLCFEQVRDRLVARTSKKLGIQEIPLGAIVGSVQRCSDYTRDFMPLKDSDQRRWTRVMAAAAEALDLPPIRAYRLGDVYFVADGHHRVSVARQRGLDHITAIVTEVQTRKVLDSTTITHTPRSLLPWRA